MDAEFASAFGVKSAWLGSLRKLVLRRQGLGYDRARHVAQEMVTASAARRAFEKCSSQYMCPTANCVPTVAGPGTAVRPECFRRDLGTRLQSGAIMSLAAVHVLPSSP